MYGFSQVQYVVPTWGHGHGYGLVDPTGFFRSGTAGPDLARAAQKQVNMALLGTALPRLQGVEDWGPFSTTAANTAGAYLKSSYLLAVIARLVGSRLLALKAQSYGASGLARLATTASELPTDVAAVFNAAANEAKNMAGANKDAQTVATLLFMHANPTLIAAQQKRTEAEKPSAQIVEKIGGAAETAGTWMRYAGWGAAVLFGVGVLWWVAGRRKA
jgi:hypothetical protein